MSWYQAEDASPHVSGMLLAVGNTLTLPLVMFCHNINYDGYFISGILGPIVTIFQPNLTWQCQWTILIRWTAKKSLNIINGCFDKIRYHFNILIIGASTIKPINWSWMTHIGRWAQFNNLGRTPLLYHALTLTRLTPV